MNWLGSVAAIVYLIFPMSIVLLLLLLMPLGFLSDVSAIRNSGFAGPSYSASLIGVSGLVIGLSLLVPPLRKLYRALPWLYAFVKILFINLIILCVGLEILNYGYQITDPTRHSTFFILMIIQIVLCRLAMSLYFKRKPVHRGLSNEE